MKVTLVLLVLLGLSFARPKWFELDGYHFDQYIKDFTKHYEPQEYKMRREIFEKNLRDIYAHNRDSTKTWKEGVNHMTDWTEEEFRSMLGYKLQPKRDESRIYRPAKPTEALPASIDWRTAGIISPVKDQGQCGSCWSFATAESIETYFAMATNNLVELSEQQVLDCTQNPNQCGGTGGCGGATTELGFGQIISQGGILSEWQYPYKSYFGTTGFVCEYAVLGNSYVSVENFKNLPTNEYDPIITALATVGPLAISVDASAWSKYESGVFNGCNQTYPDLDHAVQLVGYGTDNSTGQDYWIVRNSWTPLWGEHGFIRLYRTSSIQCGTDITPKDGDGCNNGPQEVNVCGTCGILYDANFPIVSADERF
jgi:cathepsin L